MSVGVISDVMAIVANIARRTVARITSINVVPACAVFGRLCPGLGLSEVFILVFDLDCVVIDEVVDCVVIDEVDGFLMTGWITQGDLVRSNVFQGEVPDEIAGFVELAIYFCQRTGVIKIDPRQR